MPGWHGGHALKQSFKLHGVLFTLSIGLVLGACAQPGSSLLSLDDRPAQAKAQPSHVDVRSELDRAIEYWGQQYAKDPRNKSAAISYVRNLKAASQKDTAFAVLQQASLYHSNDREIASEYGRLAVEFGKLGLAQKLLAIAHDPAQPDWRVISAQGTVLAKQGNYKGAIPYYERALQLAPDQPSLINNLAMALAADGQPDRAEPLLRRAVAHQNADPRVSQNLVLVLSLQGKHDEAQQTGMVAGTSVADVDYLRQIVTEKPNKPSTAVASTRGQEPVLRPSMNIESDDNRSSDGWNTQVAQARRN